MVDYRSISALLTEPSYCGTLAAVRELGRRGVVVWTAGSGNGAPTSASKYVTEHWRSASELDLVEQADWLERFGRSKPGTVLYPTSDDYAWLQALYAPRLEQHFRTYSPDIETIENVLDKRRLYAACNAVGIDTPVTHFAEQESEVAAIANSARFPLLLKQRTQIFSKTRTKGALVRRPEELARAHARFVASNTHRAEVYERMPFASWPLMQEFHADAHKGSYLVTGFVNRDHTACVAQAAVKVLQYPRTLGIALCMEQASLDKDLSDRILALCKLTGFFGVFQIEFLVAGDRKLLIDFNPRYYHYMAYDIARGLPLPWFAHLGACGDEEALAEELRKAAAQNDKHPMVFSYRLQLNEMLWAQRLTGTMTKSDVKYWRKWYASHKGSMIDAVADPDDRMPEYSAAIKNWWRHIRHPRAFYRQIALDL